jgi:hypothetical protein
MADLCFSVQYGSCSLCVVNIVYDSNLLFNFFNTEWFMSGLCTSEQFCSCLLCVLLCLGSCVQRVFQHSLILQFLGVLEESGSRQQCGIQSVFHIWFNMARSCLLNVSLYNVIHVLSVCFSTVWFKPALCGLWLLGFLFSEQLSFLLPYSVFLNTIVFWFTTSSPALRNPCFVYEECVSVLCVNTACVIQYYLVHVRCVWFYYAVNFNHDESHLALFLMGTIRLQMAE